MTHILSILNNKGMLIWLVPTLTFIMRIPTFLIEVFNGDETFYATAGMILLKGGIPYVDFVDNKPPLLYLIYAATFSLFGVDMRFVHGLVFLLVLGTSFFLFKTLALYSKNHGGLLAALFYAIFSIAFIEEDMWAANAEIFINFFMVVSVYCFFYSKSSTENPIMSFANLFVSGIFLSIGFLIKQQAALLYPVLLMTLIYFCQLKGSLQSLKYVLLRGGTLFFGSIIPIMLTIWHFYSIGHLEELYFWTIKSNFLYITTGPPLMHVLMKAMILTTGFVLSTLILWFLTFHHIKKRWNSSSFPKEIFFLFILYLFWTFPTIYLGGRIWGHYYILLYPPLSALGGLGACYFLNHIDRYSIKIKISFVLGIISPALFFLVFGMIRYHLGAYPSAKPFIRDLSKIVQKETTQNDKIFVWGLFPDPYYYAKRLPASRFLACSYIVPLWENRFGKHQEYRPDQLRVHHKKNMGLLMQDLQTNQPRLIIDVHATPLIDNWNLYDPKLFPDFYKLIQEYYELKYSVEGILVYERANNT